MIDFECRLNLRKFVCRYGIPKNTTRIPLPLLLLLGLVSEEIDFFVLASLAMKLREYTRNTPIRRNPVSKF